MQGEALSKSSVLEVAFIIELHLAFEVLDRVANATELQQVARLKYLLTLPDLRSLLLLNSEHPFALEPPQLEMVVKAL